MSLCCPPISVRSTSAVAPFPTASSLPAVEVAHADSLHITQSSIDQETGSITLVWPGEAGFLYDIEASPNLENWAPLATDLPGVDGVNSHTLTDTPPLPSMERFYRVVLHD